MKLPVSSVVLVIVKLLQDRHEVGKKRGKGIKEAYIIELQQGKDMNDRMESTMRQFIVKLTEIGGK